MATLTTMRELVTTLAARWTPRVVVWALLGAIAVAFAVVYLADGKPSPYGLCYASRGRTKPCEDAKYPVLPDSALVRADTTGKP